MTFDTIKDDAAVFIDANVFIYHFTGASSKCTQLLADCESGRLHGSTSALVLAEVCHRLMTIEAVQRKLVAAGNVVRKLTQRPDLVRQLSTYETAIESIPAIGIEVSGLTEAIVMNGLRLQRRYGLLTNDSLVVSTMLHNGVSLLATADRRLAAINEIETVIPNDLR
jgi:predicted nucleic acid-binding protein